MTLHHIIVLLAMLLPLHAMSADTTSTSSVVELISDSHFKHGFELLGIRSIETGARPVDRLTWPTAATQPTDSLPMWRLAQWGTRHSLQGAKAEKVSPSLYRFANVAKSVTLDTRTGAISLAAFASNEYPRPRRTNEEWPHLLVEQYFRARPPLKDLRELRMEMTVELSRFEDCMTSATADPSLHAAQLQAYLMVQNCDTSSSAHGDYFWFGLPLFDNRDPMPAESYHKDGGKEDTTHKFIYLMPAASYLKKGLADREPAAINIDLLPAIWRGWNLARQQGFLANTKVDQLAVTSINIGWELPGTYNVEATLTNLSLTAYPK